MDERVISWARDISKKRQTSISGMFARYIQALKQEDKREISPGPLILEAPGLDVDCDVATVARSIETTGIGLFNGMSPPVHPPALGPILSQNY